MASWNQWTGIGNCTRDIELRHLPSGSAVASGGIACNRKYKTAQGEEREDVLFLDFECFGKGGEILAQYANKGKPLFLSGRLALDQWEDQQGNKRSKIKLVVENFQFLGSRDDTAADEEYDQRRPHQQQTRPTRRPAARPSAPADEPAIDPSDIPF